MNCTFLFYLILFMSAATNLNILVDRRDSDRVALICWGLVLLIGVFGCLFQ